MAQHMMCLSSKTSYFQRIQGSNSGALPPKPTLPSLILSFMGSFLGIMILASITFYTAFELNPLLIGSFGAQAVLVFACLDAPLAQPRCAIGGNIISAAIGVSVNKVAMLIDPSGNPGVKVIGSAFAVSIAIFVMQITRTVHPPAGATSMIAVVGGVQHLGYLYVATIGLGSCILVLVAVIVENLFEGQQYPKYYIYP